MTPNMSQKYISRNTFRSLVTYSQNYACQELDDLLLDPDKSFNTSGSIMLKDGDTSTVWVSPVGNLKLVIKRYNIKGFWHGLKRVLRRSNAEASWNNAKILLSCGIATPTPVALVEKRIGPFRRQTYFISKFVESIYCFQFFLEPHRHTCLLSPMAQKILDLFAQLKKNKIAHGDMKGTNILITADKPILIDLDYMKKHRFQTLFNYRHLRDKQRFMRVWQDDPAITELFSSLLDK